ncbi:hypothetical protein [Tsuneonella sp. HG222]
MAIYFHAGAFHEGEDLPEGAVEVDRWPGPFETLVNGRWQVDSRGLADWKAGVAHIAEARALKFLEAQLVLAGIALPQGLLAAEAAAIGVKPKDLAKDVIAKRAAFVAKERTRQRGQAGHEEPHE